MEKRRVVITGIGVVAPNGIGIENFWDSLVQGKSAVRKITHFDASSYPCQVAAEVPDFNPTDYMEPKTAKRLGRFAQFALAASEMAVEDSGIDFTREDPYRSGVYIGTAMGGEDANEIQHSIFLEKGLKRISPFTVFSCAINSANGIISYRFNLKGPNTTTANGCTSGLDAALQAFNAIRLNDADIIVVGAGEAPITPYIFGAFCVSGFLSRENNQPKKALKPFDVNADGTVLGEGGAVLIMEELQHAIKRGARIYGEMLSYSSFNEAYDFVQVDSDNGTMVLNFKHALENAFTDVRYVDYINAHGNGVVSFDIGETQAIKKVFGELAYDIPVTSIKPITGQSFSTTGILQMVTSLLVMKHSIIPPTINLETPAPGCDLNYIPNYFLKKEVNNILINAHGFFGKLTTLVLGKCLLNRQMI